MVVWNFYLNNINVLAESNRKPATNNTDMIDSTSIPPKGINDHAYVYMYYVLHCI